MKNAYLKYNKKKDLLLMNHEKLTIKIFITIIVISLVLSGCVRVSRFFEPWKAATPQSYAGLIETEDSSPSSEDLEASAVPQVTLTLAPKQATPTPNTAFLNEAERTENITYTVKEGDYLGAIAVRHRVSVGQIVNANPGVSLKVLYPDQKLIIPPDNRNPFGSNFKIIPDSELVYGESLKDFDTIDVVNQFNGALSRFKETFWDGRTYTGAEVVQMVADQNAVNPRLLLAILEYHGGWLTQENVSAETKLYPFGYKDHKLDGLWEYLDWAADRLMGGYTAWPKGYLSTWSLYDETVYRIAPTINPATAGIQNLYARYMYDFQFVEAVSETGLYATYQKLFGDPFAFSAESQLPEDLVQPEFILPLAHGDTWYFTSGPHYGWGVGSPWTALDFAPPGNDDDIGCFTSYAPILAVADGVITRSDVGFVVLDLDGDGSEQTGWTVHYIHVGSSGRIATGTQVAAGDVIGVASCEGGYSTGTHFHIARRYNGIWVDAYGAVPFNLGGWIAYSSGTAYNGYLEKNGKRIEAYNGRSHFNEIGR